MKSFTIILNKVNSYKGIQIHGNPHIKLIGSIQILIIKFSHILRSENNIDFDNNMV